MLSKERHQTATGPYYEDFDNADSRRNFPKGKFEDFRKFLTSRSNETETEKLDKLAVTWRSEFVREATERLLRGLFVALPILSIFIFAYTIFYYIGSLLSRNIFEFSALSSYAPQVTAILAVSALVFFGWRLVRRLVSDVIAWTTVHESQENFLVRERRVRLAQKIVKDVLEDENCSRCILIGHSLGSSIILEAFQRQNALCRATNISESERASAIGSIRKVSHIFTIGSPIEKISSLFYADSGKNHRYHKIRHSNPNRLAWPAWHTSGSPRLVNFWSRYDLISSRISSLQPANNAPWKGVENVEVAPVGAPFPLAAHSGYFRDTGAMSVIYQAIASGKISDQRLIRSEFKSEIKLKSKITLTLLFLTSIIGAFVWVYLGGENGWLQLCVVLLMLLSLSATFSVVRNDFKRHWKANAD
ncbi:hypothetical protein GO984_10885 [Rhodobacteraceae bacterium CY05]|uniref:Uncharacterized protein n=1 Tax=Parasedimentitalea huanghaiensis TaxID=2682100 RepID=A0A6L6WF22_9RHOB|nr:hypothetical protein [Zongyanglinia huanghaiensis]